MTTRTRKPKAKAVGRKLIGRSGKLVCPWGAGMSVKGNYYNNGHRVIRNKLVGVKEDHYVPDHWIERKQK